MKPAANPSFLNDDLQAHGLGMKIIENTLLKYDGVMDAKETGGRYRTRIVIPLSAPPEPKNRG